MEANQSDSQEKDYDTLDNQGQLNAYEIRKKTGTETDGDNEDFSFEAITSRLGNVALNDEDGEQDQTNE